MTILSKETGKDLGNLLLATIPITGDKMLFDQVRDGKEKDLPAWKNEFPAYFFMASKYIAAAGLLYHFLK